MKTTVNLGLKKPEGTDVVNIDDLNYNADIIDTELQKRALKTDIPIIPVQSVNGKTGAVTLAAADVGAATSAQGIKADTALQSSQLGQAGGPAKQDDFASHLADNLYQTAGGTATAITLTINGALVTGYPITFIASANNGSAATTINGKPLYKPGTTTAPTLIAGKAYTIWYNATSNCFFIKASAEGNTIASHVLAGDIFSTEDIIGGVGIMPNKSGASLGSNQPINGVLSSNKFDFDIPLPTSGYMDNTTKIHQTLSNLIPSNLKKGVTIPEIGFTGTMVEADRLDGLAQNKTSRSENGSSTILDIYGSGWLISTLNTDSVSFSCTVNADELPMYRGFVTSGGCTFMLTRFNSHLVVLGSSALVITYILD